MGNIYFKASEEHHKIAYNVMSKYHSDLSKARVQIGLLLTLSNKEDQPAIKDGAFGLIKIVPVKDRVTKQFDVELIVDGDIWNKKPELRDPLIDHLLNKLEVKKPKPKKTDKAKPDDQEMDILVDDIGRPVIKMRKCDLNAVAGFSEVASRHGDISIEVLQLKEMSSKIEAAIKEKESLDEIVS